MAIRHGTGGRGEVGWVVWLRPCGRPGESMLPPIGRWTGPRDWVSPYLGQGPAELDDAWRLARPVAALLGRNVWLVRVESDGNRWRTTAVRDDPIEPVRGVPYPELAAHVQAHLARWERVHRRQLTRQAAGEIRPLAILYAPRVNRWFVT